MKTASRRIMIVVVGLVLGWWAAGIVDFTPRVAEATEATPHVESHAAEHAEHDAGSAPAEALIPRDDGGHVTVPSWYGPLVYVVIGLFVVAVLVGVPIVRRQAANAAADVTATH